MFTAQKTTKKKRAPKSKKSNGAAELQSMTADGAPADAPDVEPMPKLPKRPPKDVQETFRCTRDEHRKLVSDAADGGFETMGAYYRSKLGLS